MIRLVYITGILLLMLSKSFAQNLIPNPGFEDENICTEYTKNCAPEAWIATSLYSNYYYDDLSGSYDGSHFVGLTAGSVRSLGRRNFVRTRLLCGLRKGNQYRVEIFVHSKHNILDSIGIYFSPTDFLFEKRRFTQIIPQLWSPDGTDSPRQSNKQWKKIQWLYTASGDEAYMTIGNFKRIDYTGVSRGDVNYDYYFYIDKVSMVPVDPGEQLCAVRDSVLKEIYGMNSRHDVLQKYIYHYTKNPPVEIPLPTTRTEPVRRIDTLIIPDIFFATASYELSPKSFHVLDSFANRLQAFNIDSVIIEGHTDSVGSLPYNEKLSINRAGSVKDYLQQHVTALQQKTVWRGFAFLRPAASNKTPQGRQLNRRVEIYVYRKE